MSEPRELDRLDERIRHAASFGGAVTVGGKLLCWHRWRRWILGVWEYRECRKCGRRQAWRASMRMMGPLDARWLRTGEWTPPPKPPPPPKAMGLE